MEFVGQFDNFLLGLFGSAITWVGFLGIVFSLYLCAKNVKKNLAAKANSFDIGMGLLPRVLLLMFAFNMMMISNSNAPKVVLTPDYSAEEAAIEKLKAKQSEVKTITNLAPIRQSSEETTKRLDELREKQKLDVSLDK